MEQFISDLIRLAICTLLLLSCTLDGFGAPEADVRYGVGSWSGDLGNHRAWVRVADKCDAALARIYWRRKDEYPEQKGIVVTDATGNIVRNVYRAYVSRDIGEIAFQAEQPGDYYIYYMPYTTSPVPSEYSVTYIPYLNSADRGWLERHNLSRDDPQKEAWENLPRAEVLEIQARSEFDRFDPMEVISTLEETTALVGQYPGKSYMVFPEDRKFPIRMTRDLPLRWTQAGRRDEFQGEASRGEFYVFQLGVHPLSRKLESLAVAFTDLRSAEGKVIPSSAFRCFNLQGTDWLGRAMTKTLNVESGVQALWFGVQVPKEASSGRYLADITLKPANAEESKTSLVLQVNDKVLDDAGDGDLERLSRLRWLDSTIGLDDDVVAPYIPMKVHGRTVSCLGREVKLADTGLPGSIKSGGREILARPMTFVVETAQGVARWTGGKPKMIHAGPGSVTWQSECSAGGLRLTCHAKMEFDGYANFRISVAADGPVAVRDIRLEIPVKREVATYMMGLGREGGYRPEKWEWVWDIDRCNNAVWIGDVDAGLQCKLKGPEDTWDIYDLHAGGIPKSWGNDGKGGCTIAEDGDSTLVRAHTGERALRAGEEIEFRFGMLITPVKPLDPAHWNQRYYHAYVTPETAVESGANIINIHHGNDLNPYINYPFRTADKLAAYVKDAHAKGVKVKIYYTVRELSTHVAELWALRSLGTEVFTDGPGGGSSWLREHLGDHYAPAWHHVFEDGEVDAAIATTGLSRWHNYYLEGLAWLLKNVETDGLYLDGIGYDREIMKRARKVMDRTRPGCLIDFHSGNEFPFRDLRVSPANKYMEHFPYINSLWFGEGYDYNRSPDYWLVEVSGIPFGLYGEMLHDNGNPWRGMIYGMTARYYSGADPKHIWKFWDQFGIKDAKMIGYWSPNCPVSTSDKDVPATAYCKKGKTLVSIASWAKEPVQVRLTINWKAIGLDPAKSRLIAPAISGFQEAASFSLGDEIPVQPGKGRLLVLEERPAPTDSYAWTKVTGKAAFAPRDGAGALVFKGKMWIIGGWNPSDKTNFPSTCTNDVWSSTDGAIWTLEKPNTFGTKAFNADADWEGRHTAGYVVFKNKMWIIGGDCIQGHYQNDVWNSADGKIWQRVSRTVPWGPRVLHHTLVYEDKIWVLGGQTLPQFAPAEQRFYDDVWCTSDGINWEKVERAGPAWTARGMIGGSAVVDDRMWILGGGTYDTPESPKRHFYNDAWSSEDGAHWQCATQSAPWEPRQYHDVAVFNGRLWVLEGYAGANRNDVWYSSDGSDWQELPNTPWKPRHAASVFVYDNALWVVAGNNMESDVWKLDHRPADLKPGTHSGEPCT